MSAVSGNKLGIWFRVVILGICAVMPVFAPLVGEPYWTDIFLRVMIWAIAAISLDLILGFGGMVSFGHAMFLGVGGYTVGILAYYDNFNGFIQWPLALVMSAVVAVVVGAICIRTKGVYFIMITLAFGQMIYFLGVSAEEYGSDDGMTIYGRSEFKIGSFELDLGNQMLFYYVVFFFLIAVLWFVHRLVNSRFGMVVQGIKSNEPRMMAIGYNPFLYKLVCFAIAGVIGGLAGILMANSEEFVSPDMMHWTKSGELIFMVVLGGMGTVFGPVTGAMVFLFLSEILSNITHNWHLIFGPFLILVVLFARRGIDGLFWKRGHHMVEVMLDVQGLVKSYGGLTATDNVNLEVYKNEVNAIIGPNGAGKTTLISQLTGEVAPDAGRVVFDGQDITKLPPFERSHLGIARSFQITSVFLDRTILENAALAVQAHSGHSFQFLKPASREQKLIDPAMEILERVGLAGRAHLPAHAVSHGEHRQLEIAMAMASKPKMLFLDEPMAGMGPEESQRMTSFLQSIKGSVTILLIEHDMDAVFALADRISVLVYGKIIAVGAPDEIRNNPDVRIAYLGEGEDE